MTRNNTIVVGLTGSMAAGKSTAAARLRELGAVVIDADQASRRVVEKSGFRFLKNVVTPTARGVDEPGKMYVLYNPMKPIDKEKQPCLN